MEKGKPDLAMLLLKAKKPPMAEKESDTDTGMPADDKEMDGASAEQSAGKDIISAVKTGNHTMLVDAIKDLIETCYPSLADGKDDMAPDQHEEPDGDEADGGY